MDPPDIVYDQPDGCWFHRLATDRINIVVAWK